MKLKRLVLAGFSLLSTASFAQDFNYGEALQKSIVFYEAQQSGVLPEWNRISWRGDSAVDDGSDVGHDLTGGWYDAGDHVKFGFPMAYSATVLAWGAIEFEEAYTKSGQMEHMKNNLRFVCDYFIKAHTAPNELYGQLGNGSADHAWWGAAEVMPMERPSYKIDASNPGSDLAGETAAALAAASIVFADSDPTYSATLLQHAEELYDFADTYRGEYSDSITDATAFYNSWSGYQDEIVWGAAWLYRATNDSSYLTKAETEYENLGYEGQSKEYRAYKWGLAWDDKSYGCYVLMSMLTGKDQYKADAERHLDYWTTGFEGETIPYSPGGQAHLTTWGSLRHTANTSFLAFIYSDNVETTKADTYHDFAVRQINYTLGDNPNNRSYMMGFGVNPPLNAHHRTAHGTWTNNLTGEPENNRHILYGALVGGPGAPDDVYVDSREDYIANEVACDYNACYTGALARMYDEYGGDVLTVFPVLETPEDEFLASAKFNSSNDSGITVSVMAQNHSAWPAVTTSNLSFKYFFDITEGVEAGFSIDDYAITLPYAEGNGEISVSAWDAESNIYFAEVSFPNDDVYPGGNSESRREAQINIQVAAGMPWDISNDYSANGLDGTDRINSDNIPVYNNGVLLGGLEPAGGDTPKALFTASVESGFAPLVVEFDASESSDPNGDAITYAWVFGNGETSTSITPTITFDEIGSFEVSLIVSDGVNNSYPYTLTITTEDSNVAPVAVIEASEIAGIAPFAIDFDASSSTDENGDDLTYAWDFGDGATSTMENASHTYTETGEYEVVLTVSDGAKSDTDKLTITINDGSPVISYTYSITSSEAPFEVDFDASSSVDPEGGNLTYAWDFGNDANSDEAITSSVYNDDGEYTVTLTVTNEAGKETTEEFVIKVGSSVCNYNTPSSSALPTIGGDFQNVYILGEDAPQDLQAIEKASINWNLEDNGGSLYNFGINLKQDYSPNYINISSVSNHSFNSNNGPAISISDSGLSGLDGDYYVAEHNGNFVMVSENGDYAIYFSTSATEPTCPDTVLSNPVLDLANYEINLLPNPATEFINVVVKTTEDFKDVVREVVVVNLLGQEIVSSKIAQGETLVNLNVNSLSTGVYLVQIIVDGQRLKVEKLVVN